MLCVPTDGSETTARLKRPYFGMHRFDWRAVEVDPGGIEFNLPISAWIRLFPETGFAIEDYLELVAPVDAQLSQRAGLYAAQGLGLALRAGVAQYRRYFRKSARAPTDRRGPSCSGVDRRAIWLADCEDCARDAGLPNA